jgi:hypothetical protein
MRAWILAFAFGLVGMVAGYVVITNAGFGSQGPLWMFGGAVGMAILGAVLGGTMDIVHAIKSR